MTNEPKLPAYFRETEKITDRYLSVWCKYCGCLHNHGEGQGSRVAHCIIDTPYKNTGYYLVQMNQPLPEDALILDHKGRRNMWTWYRRHNNAKTGRFARAYRPIPVPAWAHEL